MSLNETTTALMDKVRNLTELTEKITAIASALRAQYGSDDKYTLDDIAEGIGGLKAQNLLDPGQSYDTSVDKQDWKAVTGLDIDGWNKLIGKTITVSYDLEWENYHQSTSKLNRIGMEWALKSKSQAKAWQNCWYYPQTSNGKEHVANTANVPNNKIIAIDGGLFYNQVNPECTFKATNFKIVVNPMGSNGPQPDTDL